MMVALQTSVLVIGAPRVGKLVFMELERGWDVCGMGSGKRQKQGQIQHVGRQYQVCSNRILQELSSQRHGGTMHAPFPMSTGQGQELNFVSAMALVSLSPLLVRPTPKGFQQKDFHGSSLCC